LYLREFVPYGVESSSKAVMLKFKPTELYKAYLGRDKYSGDEIKYINKELIQIESLKMLIKYDRIKTIEKGNKKETLTDRIEDFQPLIKIISFIPDLTDEEKNLLNRGDTSVREKKGEIIIALNPIFSDEINTKYVEFPADSNRRLTIAAGRHKKVTESMMTMMEYMLREISAKRYNPQINEENLPYILKLEKYVKQGRKKFLDDRIIKDIEAVKNMGIIISYGKKPNYKGSNKWVFTLNENYT
jgi:hypothetical protein